MIRDLQILKDLMGNNDPAQIQKALTAASGFVGINLEPTAKLMLPLVTVMRQRIPVDRPRNGGAQAIWRMQLGYGGFDFAANQGTATGAVGGATTGSATTIQANYFTQAINGQVEFEAIPQAQGYDDPMQIETARSLTMLLRLEELILLGGNNAAIAAPGAPTLVASASGGSMATQGAASVVITALTLQGAIANATAASNTGESAPSTNATASVTGPNGSITASWGAVPGAVGYKVYSKTTAGGELLNAVNTLQYSDGTAITNTTVAYVVVNKVIIQSYGAGAAKPGGDATAQANVWEGLIAWAGKSTVYSQSVGTKISVDSGGLKLTNTNSGIKEFDSILRQLWENWQIGPTLILCSANSAAHVTSQLTAPNSSTQMYRIEVAHDPQQMGKLIGGVFIGGYVNKFAASVLQQQAATVPVIAHPYMVDGTFLFLSERIPYQYSREARGFSLDVQMPYTYFELARSTRVFPFSLFMIETLKCYHPLAQAVISGVRIE